MDKLKEATGITSSGRTMRYPYTMTAQWRQFPWKFYWQNQMLCRYWVFGAIAAFPVFVWIHKAVNSPANVKKFADAKAKEEAEYAAHHH